MTIKELRAQSGLSQSKFAAKFNIPVRTIQAWEQEQSSPPPYLLSMIKSILDSEPQPSNTNPYYDSTFLVSRADDEKSEKRYLVELYEDELLALRDEINFILKKRGI